MWNVCENSYARNRQATHRFIERCNSSIGCCDTWIAPVLGLSRSRMTMWARVRRISSRAVSPRWVCRLAARTDPIMIIDRTA